MGLRHGNIPAHQRKSLSIDKSPLQQSHEIRTGNRDAEGSGFQLVSLFSDGT